MNKLFKNFIEKLKEQKRKLIKRICIVFSLLIVIGIFITVLLNNLIKSNINYTVDEAKAIALESVKGDVLYVDKNVELDTLSIEYEFKIKDSSNMLVEVTVDSKLGVITDLDSFDD